MSIPTNEQLLEAENYAISKLCTEIPETVAEPGSTYWDSKQNKCMFSDTACYPTYDNPFSQPMVDVHGNDYVPSKQTTNKTLQNFWKYWPVDLYVKKTTKTSPTQKVCSRGNAALYKWCNFPKTRGLGKGIDDVPKFPWTIMNGEETCMITEEYCKSRGISYDEENHDCYVSGKQKMEEFWLSPNIVRYSKVSDVRLKENIFIIEPNFLGQGINLYSYDWNNNASKLYNLSGREIGVIADEFPKKYIFIDDLGYKNINLTDNTDDRIRKLKFFLNTYINNRNA